MACAYTDAWKPWDDRLADHVIAKRNWMIAFGAAMLAVLTLTACVVWLSSRIRYVVYAVEVDKLGYALAEPHPLTALTAPDVVARMERYELALYVRDARSVTTDKDVEHQALANLLAHTHGGANRFLDDYYHADERARDPFVVSLKHTVTVQIESILPLSAQTWEVRWQEDAHDLNGAASGPPTQWEAQLTTELVTPNSADSIISNPLGFYVTQIAWTQSNGGEQ